MTTLWIDFETFCELDIKKVGAYKYVNHYSFETLCCAFAFDDAPIGLIRYQQEFDPELIAALHDPDIKIYAHNAEFEYLVLKRIGYDLPINRFVDTQALCGTYGFPLSLDNAAEALGFEQTKYQEGRHAMLKLSKPRKPSQNNPATRWLPDAVPEDYEKLYKYCAVDVQIMRRMVDELPAKHLTDFENIVWQHTIAQNMRGMKIDVQSVNGILDSMETFKKEQNDKLRLLTRGAVRSADERDKILDHLFKAYQFKMHDLTKESVAEVLSWQDRNKTAEALHPNVYEILKIRKMLSKSSTAKFEKMRHMLTDEGRIHGMLQYFGAHTGRYAGRGVQLQNLPRAQFDEDQIELILDAFKSGYLHRIQSAYGPNIPEHASKLVRPMLIGDPLYVSDYSSIENRILHWIAGDQPTLENFKQDLDQYRTFAASRFGVDYSEVTSKQRQYGKVCILGLGYGASEVALIPVAQGYGLQMSEEDGQQAVAFYRDRAYPKIPVLWYGLFNAARECIATRQGVRYQAEGSHTHIDFQWYKDHLFARMPSGRWLCYPYAEINGRMINYRGVQLNGKHGPKSIWSGLMTENVVQAIARDVLVQGALNVEKAGFRVLTSVHDEVVADCDTDGDIDHFSRLLCVMPDWARGLPLKAEGYTSKRYRKG